MLSQRPLPRKNTLLPALGVMQLPNIMACVNQFFANQSFAEPLWNAFLKQSLNRIRHSITTRRDDSTRWVSFFRFPENFLTVWRPSETRNRKESLLGNDDGSREVRHGSRSRILRQLHCGCACKRRLRYAVWCRRRTGTHRCFPGVLWRETHACTSGQAENLHIPCPWGT